MRNGTRQNWAPPKHISLMNGKPTFLLGISYFSALGASDDVVRKDLTEMKRFGFNWLRVWVTWNGYNNNISAVNGDGSPREPYLTKLKRLVAECNRRGLVVDVTLSRGGGVPPHLASLKDLNHAVETVVTELKPYENWYLDLANERNVGDSRFVSFEELKQLRATARRLAPALLVTASQGGDIGRDELREYLRTVQVDFICPHRPRDAGSPAQTASKTREYLAWMQDFGRTVPINYQEPMRRDMATGSQPPKTSLPIWRVRGQEAQQAGASTTAAAERPGTRGRVAPLICARVPSLNTWMTRNENPFAVCPASRRLRRNLKQRGNDR